MPILDQKPEPLISHYPSESVKAVSKPSHQEVKRELIDLTFSSPPTERHITNCKRSSSVMSISDSSDASQPIQLHLGNPWNRHTNLSTICEIQLRSTFDSPQTAQEAVFAYQENLGHRWRVAQSKRGTNGSKQKVTFRCNHYYHHIPSHLPNLDPSDHCVGQSIKTDCNAHVNINRVVGSDLWVVTLADWTHNHDRELPPGAPAPRRPTTAQKDLVQWYSTSATSNFNRTQLTTILKEQFPDHVLEPRQVSNLINASRAHAHEEIDSLGGDVATIIAHLQEKQSEDLGWTYDLHLNEQQQVIGLWWQSPVQAGLTRHFSDILINDNTYNRNQYGYPLNIGIGIDNLGSSRNLWYALHETEDVETQNWVNRCHLRSASKPPECYVSDQHPSLIQSAKTTLPLTLHF